MIDLSPHQRDLVVAILARHLPGRSVSVFGSRATGSAKPHSDLDLVVMGDTPLPLAVARQLRDAFEESDLPFRVDLVDWADITPEFRAIIAQTAVPLVPSA